MKSTMTDQELIDASKPHSHRTGQDLRPEDFTPGTLAFMRAIADAALEKFANATPGGRYFNAVPPPTPPMPKIKPPRPDYETMMRDEFAGRALNGLLGGFDVPPTEAGGIAEVYARLAYRFADAMLEARNANR